MFSTFHLAPNIMIGFSIASGVLLNANILQDNKPLRYNVIMLGAR